MKMKFPRPPGYEGNVYVGLEEKPKYIAKRPDDIHSRAVGDNPASIADVTAILNDTLHDHHRTDETVVKFINAYVHCRDVAQAGRMVGLDIHSAKSLWKRRDIYSAITKITDMAVLKHGLDPSEIVEKVKEIAYVDPACLENEDGSYKSSLKDVPPDVRRAIKSFKVKNLYDYDENGIKTVTGQLIEVTMWDKMKGLEFLGREKNLFKESVKVEHDVTDNMKDVLLESRERAEARLQEARDATMRETERLTIDVSPVTKHE